MALLPIPNTDLEVSAYMAGNNLVIRVNKGGVCICDVAVKNATEKLSFDELVSIGTWLNPIVRDLTRPIDGDGAIILIRRNAETGKWAFTRTQGAWVGGFDTAKDAAAAACVEGPEAIEFVETRE